MRSTARTVGVAVNTVVKLMLEAGETAAGYLDEKLVDLPCTRIEVDELWSFVYAKQKNVERAKSAPPDAGDVWTWTAICADTKLMPSWRVGDRSVQTAIPFMADLKGRLRHRVQLTTDGHRAYLQAVRQVFGRDVDYAMLIKIYGGATGESTEKRYSPATCTGTERVIIEGSPDLDKISTSYAERSNLTMRMSNRRFTRLTNAFSKKLENHAAMVALSMFYYNLCRRHQTLRTTPAVAAGVRRSPMTLESLIKMLP